MYGAHAYYGDAYGAHGYSYGSYGYHPTTTTVYTEKVHHEPIIPEKHEKATKIPIPYHADPTAPHTHHEIEHREGSYSSS